MIGDEELQTTPEAAVEPGENFEAAFDRLAELATEQIAQERGEEPPPAAEPVVAQEAPVDDAQAETPVADDAQVEEPAPEPPPVAPDAKEDMLEKLARLVAEREQHQVPPEQQMQPQAAPQAEQYYTNDEVEFLTNYEKEWPDVSKAEAIRRRAEYKQLVGYVFSEVAKELSPLLNTVRTLSERTHLGDLQSRIENYAQDRDAVIDWVSKQPAYLQPAYRHVIQQGTVDEVADLITRFRQETGAQRAAPAATKPKTDLPAATKQAAAALAPVSSKRSAVIRGTDPNDFESAFEEFAGKL